MTPHGPIPPEAGSGTACCPATNLLLASIDTTLGDVLLSTDGLEACCAAGNAILQAIEDNTDGIEALLSAPLTVAVNNFPASVEISNDVGNAIPVTGSFSSVDVVTAFTHGQNTDIDSGADEQIVVASNPATKGVMVKALPANTGILYIGIVGVTTITGMPLEAGEVVSIPVDNANKVYAISDVNNQGLAWIAS